MASIEWYHQGIQHAHVLSFIDVSVRGVAFTLEGCAYFFELHHFPQ